MADAVKRTRTYHSSIKRGEARAAVLASASRLFADPGYLATSIPDLARDAGVARPTVFAAVGTKPEILRQVLEVALAGDQPDVVFAERPWFREVLEESDPRRMLRLHARNIRAIGERISALYRATEAAAQTDPTVAAIWAEVEAGRLRAAQQVGRALVGLGRQARLRRGLSEDGVVDVLFSVVSPPVYRSFVRERGWTPEQFERWAADALERMLLVTPTVAERD